MTYNVYAVQARLKELGLYKGAVDGIAGPLTHAAIVAFKRNAGLRARPYVGPITLAKLLPNSVKDELPWINEINKVLGLHEVRDNKVLTEWLKSDGHALGDPAKLPWCGDAAETAIRRALPEEIFPPALDDNPYWARNWAQFGRPCDLVYGAAVSFVRPGGGGHIGFLVGISADGKLLRVRGGNQSNALNDTWIAASRLLASRWPNSFSVMHQRPAPVMASNGAIVSHNEA